MKATEIKTLVINKELRAAGRADSLLRYARRIVRKENLQNPEISLIKGIITQLENAV